MSVSPKRSLLSRFSIPSVLHISLFPMHDICPAHLMPHNLIAVTDSRKYPNANHVDP
jgi:hypothetical protein